MRILPIIFFVLSYFGTLSVNAQTCENLFADLTPTPVPMIVENIPSKSDRIELQKITNSTQAEKLTLEASTFSKNTDQAAIELMRLLLQNSSYVLEEKNVLNKNELVIGVPIKDGYFFEIAYKALANERSQFIIDKISLKTPTGADSKKVAEGFLKANAIELKKNEFEIGSILGAGINAKLKIPLIIDGPLLTKLDTLAKFFEYFRKDEMRKLLQTNSMLKIRAVFEYRRARDVFFKVLFKEPMKTAIGFGFIILAAGSLPFNQKTDVDLQPPVAYSRPAYEIVSDRINGFQVPEQAITLKVEIAEINKQIKTHFSENDSYNGPKYNEIDYPINAFSRQHNTWVFEKIDSYNKSIHTYIVVAEEKASPVGPGLQYMIMEIDAAKYPLLIKYIKDQGKIPTVPVLQQGKAG